MPRPAKVQSPNGNAETAATTKRTRTKLNSVILFKQQLTDSQAYFVAIHNGEVTAAFAYDESQRELVRIPDTMGAYKGMKTYVREMRSELTPILVTKSVDNDVVSAQADVYVMEKFIQNYLDRKTAQKEASSDHYHLQAVTGDPES